jgi:hypothetical protein
VPATTALTLTFLGVPPASYSPGWKSTFALSPTVHDVARALKYASPQVPGSSTTLRGCGAE